MGTSLWLVGTHTHTRTKAWGATIIQLYSALPLPSFRLRLKIYTNWLKFLFQTCYLQYTFCWCVLYCCFSFFTQFSALRTDIDLTSSHPEPEGRSRAHRTVREMDVLGDGVLLISHLYSPQLLPSSTNISRFFKTRVKGLEGRQDEEDDERN